MKICPNCQNQNPNDSAVCANCGRTLPESAIKTPVPTVALDEISKTTNLAEIRSAEFEQDYLLVLQIEDAAEVLILHPERYTVLGRMDVANVQQPDIDLTPYGALAKGVSRLHAVIYRGANSLMLFDLGSSNGTYLEEVRLSKDEPHSLHNGDAVRLGYMQMHVYFRTPRHGDPRATAPQ
jgi:hypothetical protein